MLSFITYAEHKVTMTNYAADFNRLVYRKTRVFVEYSVEMEAKDFDDFHGKR